MNDYPATTGDKLRARLEHWLDEQPHGRGFGLLLMWPALSKFLLGVWSMPVAAQIGVVLAVLLIAPRTRWFKEWVDKQDLNDDQCVARRIEEWRLDEAGADGKGT